MVIDSSAILAILLLESDAETFAEAIETDPTRLVSAVSFLEVSIVIQARKGGAGGRELDLLLHRAGVEIASFTGEQAELAAAAWLHYGKGRHPAGLNLGDCCSYALAKVSGERLLYKGQDFAKTDVAAWRPLL